MTSFLDWSSGFPDGSAGTMKRHRVDGYDPRRPSRRRKACRHRTAKASPSQLLPADTPEPTLPMPAAGSGHDTSTGRNPLARPSGVGRRDGTRTAASWAVYRPARDWQSRGSSDSATDGDIMSM